MSEWETHRLGDIALVVDCEHKTAPPAEPGEEYGYSVGTPHIRDGRVNYEAAKRVSKETFEAWSRRATPAGGDLILAREAPVGQVGRVAEELPTCLGQRTVLVRPNHAIANERFLHAYLLGRDAQRWMKARSSGSTVAHLNVADVREIPISLPAMDEQHRIATVLGAFDDLIEASRRLAEDLAEMQRADFLSSVEGTTERLGAVAAVTMGQSPPGSTYNEKGEGTPFYQGVRDFGWRFPASRVWTTAPTRFAYEGDVLIAVRAPVGETNVAVATTALGRGVAAARAATRQATLLQALRADPTIWDVHQGTGTVFASINKKSLNDLSVPWVDDESLERRLGAGDAAIRGLHGEIEDLTRARDELLPLLMSGRVRVADARGVA